MAVEPISEGNATIKKWPFITGVFFAVVSIPGSLWLKSHLTDIEAASLGFHLTLWGLAVSIIGFSFTIWQLTITRTATAAVSSAIRRLRTDIGSLDIVTELRTATSAAEEAQSHILAQRWPQALLSYNKVRHCLYKAVAIETSLTEADVETAKDFIAHALGACAALEGTGEDSSDIDSAGLTTKLKELEGFLISLEYKIKDAFGGK